MVLLAACGGGSGGSSGSSTSTTTSPATPPTTPAPTPAAHTDVVTYKNDVARTGQNLTETILTLSNVNSTHFGRRTFMSTDGKVDAQPLYLGAATIAGTAHNVLFAATENDSVYAFDAATGATLWHVSLLGTGESPSGSQGCSQVVPTIGVTADTRYRSQRRSERRRFS